MTLLFLILHLVRHLKTSKEKRKTREKQVEAMQSLDLLTKTEEFKQLEDIIP